MCDMKFIYWNAYRAHVSDFSERKNYFWSNSTETMLYVNHIIIQTELEDRNCIIIRLRVNTFLSLLHNTQTYRILSTGKLGLNLCKMYVSLDVGCYLCLAL